MRLPSSIQGPTQQRSFPAPDSLKSGNQEARWGAAEIERWRGTDPDLNDAIARRERRDERVRQRFDSRGRGSRCGRTQAKTASGMDAMQMTFILAMNMHGASQSPYAQHNG